jgi:phenylpropionate dioxygenase-like ring-hydroxylating dioxygenase large terminal subunit
MPFLRNTWYAAGWADDLGRALMARTLLNERVLMYRLESGTPVAIGGVCPHRFAPLHMGKLVGDLVECPYHGLRFDSSGKCAFNPHEDGKVPARAQVRSYPLVERDGILWIWMGEAKNADPLSIVSYPAVTDPELGTVKGSMHLKAHFELIVDNLMDLSHVQFLHPTFGATENFSSSHQEVTIEGQTVVSTRWIRGGKGTPLYARNLPDPTASVDSWVVVSWDVPSVCHIDVGVTLPGKTKEEGLRAWPAHLVTPETEETSHYFYAHSRNFRVGDAEVDAQIVDFQRVAFGEQDRPVIEAIQQTIGNADFWSLRPAMFSVDTASVRARRVLQQLIAEENREISAATQHESRKTAAE